jgi:hypothetical protein
MKVIKFLGGFSLLVFILTKACEPSSSEPTPSLNASVSFDGKQFTIQNKDTFDYVNTTLKINSDYQLEGKRLAAGETYKVGILQFANDKGERFTFNLKPQTFHFSCINPEGKRASFYSEFN